jgi:spore coat protein CotH
MNEHENVPKPPVQVQDIVVINKDVSLKNNHTTEIYFRVNPSNADVDLKCFHLDSPDTYTKAVSYITVPENVKISSIQIAQDKSHNRLRGQYVMTIADKELSTEYIERVAIVYSSKDSEGHYFEVSSDVITITSAPLSDLLPKVYIDTPDGAAITSKTVWTEGSTIKIINADGSEDLNATTSIRGRGNSTWGYPKKPYAIKLDSKAEVLGMPKHKRWVLLANWMDRTLMRNGVAFEMARRTMEWAPRGKFVELYLNGKHQGNYYLCEQIKVDENRVDVGDDGYIFEFDTYGPNDEINYFYTPVKNYPVTIKEPDEDVITSWEHPRFVEAQEYIGNVEQTLESDRNELTRWDEITELIDITSYIDWWVVHELTFNTEPSHPKSCYMYKKGDGKLYAGPVWDFDWGTFRKGYSHMALLETLWYGYLFRYPEFKTAVKERWSETKATLEDVQQYIADQTLYLEESNNLNFKLWPLTGAYTNGDESLSYPKATEKFLKAYQERLTAVNSFIDSL